MSAAGGGVFEVAVEHARLLRQNGIEPVLIGGLKPGSQPDPRLDRFETIVARRTLPLVNYAHGLLGRCLEADLDILHLHGVWQAPSLQAAIWAERTGRPLVISPHGMFDPWIVSRGKPRKVLAKIGYEKRAWKVASRFHALTEDEAGDIRTMTGKSAITVIPNAVPIPDHTQERLHAPRARRMVFISRIHPKKNVEMLVDAWIAAFGADGSGWTLDIYGWGADSDVAALEAKIAAHGSDAVRYKGPVFGDAKAAALLDARFLVLPSHSEGLPVTILEAWASGLPTIMTSACHLEIGFECNAALETGLTNDAIANSLKKAAALDDPQWRTMSENARDLATGHFASAVVGASLVDLYKSLARP